MFKSYKVIKHHLTLYNVLKRFKHKETHWSVVRKKKTACDKALEHFDDFYGQIFGQDWEAIRQGLLSKQKYIAVVNNFSDSDNTIARLERIGVLNIRTLLKLEKEYIHENYEMILRKKKLTQILKAAETEDNVKTNDIIEETTKRSPYDMLSLEKNLSRADIDFSRLISSNSVSVGLSDFMPVTKIKGKEDWISDPAHTDILNNSEFKVPIKREYDLHFPDYLNAYCYEIGNHNDFSAPRNGSTGVLDYYLMDGGSLLPVLALDLKPGDRVLDMCAAPGGKSYLAMQTLYPDHIVCNDITKSRTDRIYNMMSQYFYDLKEKWLGTGKLHILLSDGRDIKDGEFNKIIVDVPCTTDRHSLREPENNIFKASRIKERLKLPDFQSQLLIQALKLVQVGGNVVYSTCSLSPTQNDGVVHMALKKIWEETNIEISVCDLSVALLQTNSVYKLADQKLMKYGHLVVPNLQVNFGPTYFCKMQKLK